MSGFFPGSTLLRVQPPVSRIPKCGACGLYKGCQSPKMPVTGKGRKGILIVGEAPGKTEDEQNQQFVGVSGELLRKELLKYGIEMRRDCWLHNTLICRPPDNRDPKPHEIDACRPNMLNILEDLKPELILPLGRFGMQGLIELLWAGDFSSGYKWTGWRIPCQQYNAWVCPTYHPAFISRRFEVQDAVEPLMWSRHIEAACELVGTGRPWKEVPNYPKQVERIINHREAARLLRKMREKGGSIGVDLETNMIKPEGKGARILSCGVCWEGRRTIAYPWHGEAIEATRELMVDKEVRKRGFAMKFEQRWLRHEFGEPVRGWEWDGQVGAHWLDCRRGICNLDFQAFVLLGVGKDALHINQFKKAAGDGINRMAQEVDLDHLLLYNGLDALLHYHVAEEQMKWLN